jgi:hypothetical protein
VRRRVFRGLAGAKWWFVLLLLTFFPTIGLARVIELGIEIGWIVVVRVR